MQAQRTVVYCPAVGLRGAWILRAISEGLSSISEASIVWYVNASMPLGFMDAKLLQHLLLELLEVLSDGLAKKLSLREFGYGIIYFCFEFFLKSINRKR